MVEGDLVDLSLPSLLHALSKEGSTMTLRLQRGVEQGVLHFSEGTLVHASSGDEVGDTAVHALLSWDNARFRLARDPDRQPRTVTRRVSEFLMTPAPQRAPGTPAAGPVTAPTTDESLLTELMTLVTRLEQDRVRLAEGAIERESVAALLVLTAVVNSVIAFVTSRCSDLDVRPSRVLPRLAETQPYTQLLGEENDRISITTAAGVLKTWDSATEDRQSLFRDLCRALLDVLGVYCNAASTFFHGSRDREEWKATFDVFIDGLWTAVQVQVSEPLRQGE